MKRPISLFVSVLLLVLSLSGCYRNQQVSESQIALLMPDGNVVSEVKGAGRYTDMGYWSDINVVDVSSKTFEWTDPDLVTNDKQVIGVSLSVTVQRDRQPEKALFMWKNYNTEAQSDESLKVLVLSRLARSAKNATAEFSLDAMLGTGDAADGGRTALADAISAPLDKDLDAAGVVLIDVGVTNISPSQSYRDSLDAKAKAQADTEVTKQRTIQTAEQLNQEKAQTAIQVEIASRDRQVQEERSKAFSQSPELFELEKLKIVVGAIGNGDKIYFVPAGTDLSFYLNPLAASTVITK